MLDLAQQTLHIPDDTQKKIGESFLDNPELFEIFQNAPKMDEEDIAKKANEIRKNHKETKKNDMEGKKVVKSFFPEQHYPQLFNNPEMTEKDKE